jgi:hypothetical protein
MYVGQKINVKMGLEYVEAKFSPVSKNTESPKKGTFSKIKK